MSQLIKPKPNTKSIVQPTSVSPESLMALEIITPYDANRGPEPIRQGVPLAIGLLSDANEVGLVNENGHAVAVQCRVLSRWADGSIQWLLLDFLHRVDTRSNEIGAKISTTYQVLPGCQTTFSGKRLRSVAEVPDASIVAVETAWGEAQIGPHGGSDFLLIKNHWKCCLKVRLIDGRKLTFRTGEAETLESGPIRTVVVVSGDLIDDRDQNVLSCRIEVHLVADVRLMRCTLTLTNPAAATHPGGIWELGDPNSVEIAEAVVVIEPLATEQHIKECRARWSIDGTSKLESGSLPWSLYQDSSGGENWNCDNHVDRHGNVPLQFCGYRLTTSEQTLEGHRANPFVECQFTDGSSLAVSYPQFWQNFPKALSLSASELRVGLFPSESNRPHELQPGEQKTHQFWIGGELDASQKSDSQTSSAVLAVHQPALVTLQFDAVAQSETIPWLTPKSSDPDSSYNSLVDAAIEGNDTFFQKRETIDQYGWRHFGDVYGDHEAAFSDAQPPLISHFNNQYDQVLGFGIQYLRGGDPRWIEMMRDLAWHVVDIDIYHATTDKKAYNGGQFWHTCHYIGAGKATHRSYPTGSCGGGPASEQGYARGLGLYYFLTGEEMMRQTVGRMGQWIIAADDGSATPFRWLSKQWTGLTSASGTIDYQGPGRGPGNAIEVSVAAFETTGRQEFLDEAEKLIRRVIHPQDDIESRNLLDAERRWYYTLFLQSLGRYLWVKHQHGQHDYMYGYGRACLLHYAAWMCENEYPYLTKPEILEYPTETWAAQDMRKCEVFQWASLHATGESRAKMLERAKFFFEYSTKTLSKMETRTFCRPVALLLSNGFSRASFLKEESIPCLPLVDSGVSQDFGQPTRFVPQKIQAIKRAKLIAAIGAAISLIAVGILAWQLHS